MSDTYEIIKAQDANKGWYIRTYNRPKIALFLRKDLTLNHNTGWRSELTYRYGEAPGYYHSAEEAKQYLNAYLYIENLKRNVLIREANVRGCGGWYVNINGEYLWKDEALHAKTGFIPGHFYGDAPGYYYSPADAAFYVDRYVDSEKEKQLTKIKEMKMDTNLQAKLDQNKTDIEKLQEEQKRLEKEIENKEKPKLKVHTLKAEVCGGAWPIEITSGNEQYPKPVFFVHEVKEIITGLQKLVNSVENNQ